MVKKLVFVVLVGLTTTHLSGQKYRINDIYYDADDAFQNIDFVTINTDDQLASMFGFLNLQTLETVARNTQKAKSDGVNFQDTPLPFFIKKASGGQLHLAWTVKQIEKEKYRKLVRVKSKGLAKSPNQTRKRINPNENHSTVFLIFKSPSTVTLSNGLDIVPTVKNGVFNPEVVALKIYEEGRLQLSINQSSNKKNINLFFGEKHYVLVDYRNSVSYLDLYPEYMGQLMINAFDPKVQEVKDIKLSLSSDHKHINALRNLSEIRQNLKDSANAISPDYALNSTAWIYLGNQGKDGKAHGIGDAISKDGQKFILSGFFESGALKSGVIETTWGERFVGNFDNYKLNGQGEYIGSAGTVYSGQYTSGMLEGEGKTIFPNGCIYVGQFKNNLFSGKGRIDVPNGDYYEGTFENGLPHGHGIFNTNGKEEKCEYINGRRIDRAFSTTVESQRTFHLRKMTELDEKKRLKYLNIQQRRRTANQLFKQLALASETTNSVKVGLDGKVLLEKLPRRFPGIISDITDDLVALNDQWVDNEDSRYEKGYGLHMTTSLAQYPTVYQKEFQTAQIFMEEQQVKNAESNSVLSESGTETNETDKEEESDDDWGWEEETPIEAPTKAKDVWVPAYFHGQDGSCQVWKWTSYSAELKICPTEDKKSAFVTLKNLDYDPVKAFYKVQFVNGKSTGIWEAHLEPNTNTREACGACVIKGPTIRGVYMKDFELDIN